MATTWFSTDSGTVGNPVVLVDSAAHVPAADVGTAAQGFTGSTFQYVADAMHGARALKISGASGGQSYARLTPISGWTSRTVAITSYFKFDTAATQDNTHIYVGNGATRIFALNRNGANKWRALSTDNTNIWTSTNAVPVSGWVRAEVLLTIDATTATSGVVNIAIYDGDTMNLLETEVTLTVNLGTAAATSLFVGKFDSGTYAGGITFDSYGYNDTATARLGRYPSATSGDAFPTGSSTGGLTRAGTASTDAAALGDSDDTTYLETGALTGTAQTFRIAIQPLTPRTSLAVSFRLRMAGSGTCTATARLMQGSTNRGTLGPISISASWADYTLTASAAQIAAITDWSSLAVEIDATL